MNLKAILLTSLFSLTAVGAIAIPAKRDLRTIRQSDGTEIRVRLIGDEFCHSYVTEDGLTVERAADGDFYYLTSSGRSSVKANNPELRKSDELNYISAQKNSLGMNALLEARSSQIANRKAKKVATRSADSQVPQVGSPRIPILLVQYKDKKFKDADPLNTFNEFFRNGEVSALKYFADQSNGKYTPQFDVYGPVTLSGNRVVYGGNDAYGEDRGCGNMVAEGALALDSQVDFSKYDNDGDGECDVLIVLYAGDGEASSYDRDAENAIWPCQWTLSSSEYRRALTLDGTRVDKFAVFNELNGSDLKKIDGIGTFCHEFSHCLGLPDFYETTYGNGYYGMGPWSLMDYGSYNDDTYTPIGYSAYEKAFMGWIDIEEGQKNTKYSLTPFNSMNEDWDKAVKLTSSRNSNHYFVMENRKQQGWDKFIPAEGLFIYRVSYDANAWYGNSVNDYANQRMCPVPADNSLKMNYDGTFNMTDCKGDLWPYNGNNAFTDTSTPAAVLYDGSKLGKPVTDITKNGDGTVSFWVMRGAVSPLDTPQMKEHSINSFTSATINWESGMENEATFTIEMKEPGAAELVVSTIFDDDNHGWDLADEGYEVVEEDTDGKVALRLGSNKKGGEVTSPAFEGNGGTVTLIVRAKYYNNDNSKAIVTLVDGNGNSFGSNTIALSGEYKDYIIEFSGAATNLNAKIGIEGPKKRIWIESVDIYNGAAADIETTRASNRDVRLIEGIEGTSYTFTDLKEGAVYEYRIKAVPRDSDSAADSKWTEKKTIDLSSYNVNSGVSEIDMDNSSEVFYNIQGMKVDRPLLPGVYILKKGNKSRKVIISK